MEVDKYRLVMGQKVDPVKAQRARGLRHRMSEAESRLWQAVKANRLDGLRFRRQQVIDGFITDYYCHEAGLVVEVDGPIHTQSAEHDSARDRVLSAPGLRIVRLANAEIMADLPGSLNRTVSCARSAAMARPDPPSTERASAPPSVASKECAGSG